MTEDMVSTMGGGRCSCSCDDVDAGGCAPAKEKREGRVQCKRGQERTSERWYRSGGKFDEGSDELVG